MSGIHTLIYLKRKNLTCLALFLFLSIFLTSCTPAAEINVACNVGDLVDAINDANANSDTTRLILEPNCTYPFSNKDNSDGGQGPNALPVVTTKIVIEGNNATLLRDTSIGFRFFFITGSGNLRIEDLTLENGYALITSGVQPNSRGGAIFNDEGGFRAERSVFLDNHAWHGEGGAIYNLGVLTLKETLFEINGSGNGGAIFHGGTLGPIAVFENVSFDRNFALDNGGAIYNATTEADIMITGSTFDNNHSYEFHGGAIYTEGGDLEVYNSDFLRNTSGSSSYPTGDGGAIYNLAGDLTLSTNNFSGNLAYGVGGMIYAGPSSNVKLKKVWSEVSYACHGGGALYVEGETEILQSTFEETRAGGLYIMWGLPSHLDTECDVAHGGAIYNTGTLSLDQSLLDGYTAEGDGHGIYNLGNLTVVNSTFNIYTCSTAEAINNQGSAEVIFSTIMHSNIVNSGNMAVKNIIVANCSNGCINTGTFVDWDENVALHTSCPFSIILGSFSDLKIDLTLSDNGGPTLTHHVDSDSPVIDMATISSISGGPVLMDQRGETRPIPGSGSHTADIGAFERQYSTSPQPPPLPPTQMPEPSTSCDPLEGEEISLVLLNLPPDTGNLPVYLRVAEGIFPGFEVEPALPYIAWLGKEEAYLISQQGFPGRAYFMFNIPEGMEGTEQPFTLWLPDCPDPVYMLPAVLIPVPKPVESTCSADLGEQACIAAGGTYYPINDKTSTCICP